MTTRNEVKAALHRLRVRDGYPAVSGILTRYGVAGINQLQEADFAKIISECPYAGTMTGAADGKKPSVHNTLNNMALDRNAQNQNNLPHGDDIGGAMKELLDSEDGFNKAGHAMNLRGGPKAAQ